MQLQLQLINQLINNNNSKEEEENADLLIVLDGTSGVDRLSENDVMTIRQSLWQAVTHFLCHVKNNYLITILLFSSSSSSSSSSINPFQLISFRLSALQVGSLADLLLQRYLNNHLSSSIGNVFEMLQTALDCFKLIMSSSSSSKLRKLAVFTCGDALSYSKSISGIDQVIRLRQLFLSLNIELSVYYTSVSVSDDLYHLIMSCNGSLINCCHSSFHSHVDGNLKRNIFDYQIYSSDNAGADNVDDDFYYYILEDTVLTAPWLQFIKSKLMQGFSVVYSESNNSNNGNNVKKKQFAFALELPVSPMVSFWCRLGFTGTDESLSSDTASPILIKVQYVLLSTGFIIDRFKEVRSSSSLSNNNISNNYVTGDLDSSNLDLHHMTRYLLHLADKLMSNKIIPSEPIDYKLSVDRELQFFQSVNIVNSLHATGKNVRILVEHMVRTELLARGFVEVAQSVWKRSGEQCTEAVRLSNEEDIQFKIQFSYLTQGILGNNNNSSNEIPAIGEIRRLLNSIQDRALAFCTVKDQLSLNSKIDMDSSRIDSLLHNCRNKISVQFPDTFTIENNKGDTDVTIALSRDITIESLSIAAEKIFESHNSNETGLYRLLLVTEAISHGYALLTDHQNQPRNVVNVVVKSASESFMILSFPIANDLRSVAISYFSEEALVTGHSGESAEDLYFESKIVEKLMYNAYMRLVFCNYNLGKQSLVDEQCYASLVKRQIEIDITDSLVLLSGFSVEKQEEIFGFVDQHLAELTNEKLIKITESMFTKSSSHPVKDSFLGKLFFISLKYTTGNTENIVMPESLQSYDGHPEIESVDVQDESLWAGFSEVCQSFEQSSGRRIKIIAQAWHLNNQNALFDELTEILTKIDKLLNFLYLKLWFMKAKILTIDKEVDSVFSRCCIAKYHLHVDLNLIENTKDSRGLIASCISDMASSSFNFTVNAVGTSPQKTMIFLTHSPQKDGLYINISSSSEIIISVKVKENYISLDFSALKEDENVDIVSKLISEYLHKCIFRINQLELLRQLNETRIASKYLIAPSSSDHLDEEEMDLDKVFSIGEFRLPSFYKKTFPLHWRCKPPATVNLLCANVFHPFAIANRNNYFVYAAAEKIFYFQIFASQDSFGSLNDVSQETTVNSPDTSSPSPQLNIQSPLTSSGARKTPFSRSQSDLSSGIVFEIYGDSVPAEAVEQISSLIDNKIRNLTLNLISTYLARNLTSRLSNADVNFLIPDSRKPELEFHMFLPRFDALPESLSAYLLPIPSVELKNVVENGLTDSLAGYNLKDEHIFIYNSLSTRGMAETNFGQGLIILAICVSTEESLGNNFEISSGNVFEVIEGLLSSKSDVIEGSNIVLRLWIHGNVDKENVRSAVQTAFKYFHCKYLFNTWLDKELFADSDEPSIDPGTLSRVFKRLAGELVLPIETNLRMPPTFLKDLLGYINMIIFTKSDSLYYLEVAGSFTQNWNTSSLRTPTQFRSLLVCSAPVDAQKVILIECLESKISLYLTDKTFDVSKISDAMRRLHERSESRRLLLKQILLCKLGISPEDLLEFTNSDDVIDIGEVPCLEENFSININAMKELLKAKLLMHLDVSRLESDYVKAYIQSCLPFTKSQSDLPDIPKSNENVTLDQYSKIRDSARLIYWCSSPIFCESFSTEDAITDNDGLKSARETFTSILNSFVEQYSNYLEGIGFKTIHASLQNTMISSFAVNSYVKIEAPLSVFVKSFSEGVLMIELKFQGNRVYINVFVIENLKDSEAFSASLASWSHSENIHRQVFRSFTEYCSKIKNFLRLDAFSYEFQVRLVIKFLEGTAKGMFKEDGVLTSNVVNVISTIESISKHYSNMPSFLNSHILEIRHKIADQLQMDAVQMLKYIRKQPGHFNVRLMAFNNRITSAFKCLTYEVPPQIFEFAASKVYLVMLLETDDTVVRIYMLFETDQKIVGTRVKDDTRIEKLQKYAALITGNIYNQALRFYSRDALWRRLCDFATSEKQDPSVFKLNDFLILSTRYSSQPISHYDKSIEELLEFEIPWSDVLVALTGFYRKHIVFQETRSGEDSHTVSKNYLHLILLNPVNADLLIYFLLDIDTNKVSANAVSREWRNQDVLDSAKGKAKKILQAEETMLSEECQFISDIIRTISFILLSCAKKR